MILCVYSMRTYEKKISNDYYCQIVTHEVCDENKATMVFNKSNVFHVVNLVLTCNF
jgi:hypothetical protein